MTANDHEVPAPILGGGYLGEWDLVPVRFEGGPLDGEINRLDYTENENREHVGETWDYTPRSLSADNPDVAERYRLEYRPAGWVYVHVGTFDRETGERR